jgi:SNARE protein 1
VSKDVSHVLEQHRQLQEGLTDEMVELAQAIKMNSLAMEQSMKETEKVRDRTPL